MPNRTTDKMHFGRIGRRHIEVDFSAGRLSSDGGLLLLKKVDRKLGLTEQFAAALIDRRHPDRIKHQLKDLVAQRIYALCCAYEDLNDHNQLRYDPMLQTALGKVEEELASAPTLCRLEKNISRGELWALNKVLFDQFIARHERAPERIILDFDASDVPLHGDQEGKQYHGYYNCYCYLPLYVYCGDEMLACLLRNSRIDGAKHAGALCRLLMRAIHTHWPNTEIIFRGDSGFNRVEIIEWIEHYGKYHRAHYIVGQAKNNRLKKKVALWEKELEDAYHQSGQKQRRIEEFDYQADKWTNPRRTITRLEYGEQGNNPRFITTSLRGKEWNAYTCYDGIYCARGEAENRIKETQLELFALRSSASAFRANFLRHMFSACAYNLMMACKRMALSETKLARASTSTIRNKLLKIGALILINTRRIRICLASNHPYQDIFRIAIQTLGP